MNKEKDSEFICIVAAIVMYSSNISFNMKAFVYILEKC